MDSSKTTNKPGNESDGKKGFNKKKWREQKYSVKAKVKRWEDKRKKNMTAKYHKELKKIGVDVVSKKIELNDKKGMGSLKRAQMEYKNIQDGKKKRKEEQERVRQERLKAIQAYKEKKAARFKKLSQKTNKGQPLMKGRIELLLEQIEKNYVHPNT